MTLRSDALRNKEGILAVAVRAFAKDANASLEGIAKAAGVGIGTLYRHYPTREALFEAAYRNEIKKLCDVAPGLHKRYPADVALEKFLDRFVDHMIDKPGMMEAIRAIIADGFTPMMNESLDMVRAVISPIIEDGKSQELLRQDLTIEDFISVKGAIANSRPDHARRLAALLMDGLRHRPKKKGR